MQLRDAACARPGSGHAVEEGAQGNEGARQDRQGKQCPERRSGLCHADISNAQGYFSGSIGVKERNRADRGWGIVHGIVSEMA
jgi:hypothetical protein